MEPRPLYADPYYAAFYGTLRSALDAWSNPLQRTSLEAWVDSIRLQTALGLLTVGADDAAVLAASNAWDASSGLLEHPAFDSILQGLAQMVGTLETPRSVPWGGKHSELWIRDFLHGVDKACEAIDAAEDADDGVEPHYVPNRDMDALVASVVYLSAWQVPGHQAGEEYVHWAVFCSAGQPPPRTSGERDTSRFPWAGAAMRRSKS